MYKHINRMLSLTLFTLGLSASAACSAPSDAGPPQTGALSVPLRSELGGTSYELRDATFAISGADDLILETEAGSGATSLQAELLPGNYNIELAPGWQLVRLEEGGLETGLDATLVSDNPLLFTIAEAQTTAINYRFEIAAGQSEEENGLLELTIDVVEAQVQSLLITEFMSNPAEVGDSAGEWIELFNAGSDALDLQGCSVERDTSSFTIDTPLAVAPGQHIVLSNGDTPGFTPDYVYSGVTLPNSALFVLSVRCGDEVLDTISVDPGSWPGSSGVSASLSGDVLSPLDNDDAGRWCDASSAYNSDLGTPGQPNPVCAL